MLFITLVPASVSKAAEYTFSISDFVPGDWSGVTDVIDDPFVAAPGPGFSFASFSDLNGGGNPGSYRRIAKSNFRGDILVINDLYTAQSYAIPGDGVESISFRWDGLTESTASDATTPFTPILVQDGVLYYSLAGVQAVLVDTGWQELRWDTLLASSFDTNRFAVFGLAPPDGVHPDFSPSGSPINFGYATIGQVLGSPFLAVNNGIDNFSVTFTSNAAIIPEPTGTFFAAAVLAAISARRRRRRTTVTS
jgi:MYXO-CTERM domain-containing protein